MEKRLAEINLMRQVSPGSPNIVGAALILPKKHVESRSTAVDQSSESLADAAARKAVEMAAMGAVMRIEEELGFKPKDVSEQKLGWDIESQMPETGNVRFLEVKGRRDGARDVTVTKNEILASFNKPESFYLVVVEVHVHEGARRPKYIPRPFKREPDFGVTTVTYHLDDLLARAKDPEQTKGLEVCA